MENAGVKLKELYGLLDAPNDKLIVSWGQKTKKYLASGLDLKLAGKLSAILIFPEFGSVTRIEKYDLSELIKEL